MSLLMSQDDLARAIRNAGRETGEPNDASKRLVQRWEAGTTGQPRPVYARALERVTGLPIGSLGFRVPVPRARVTDDGRGGHDMQTSDDGVAAARGDAPRLSPAALTDPRPVSNHSGIWLSRYEYYSSGRDAHFTGRHHVLVLQHGTRLTVRSLPGSADSSLSMDLEVVGNVVTGNWNEQTAQESYYHGARYHGAVQLLVEPTGRRMAGKWVGFGSNFDVNTGPWEFVFLDPDTGRTATDRWNHPPEDR